MTKIDFAIHLFSATRETAPNQRAPIVAYMVLLELARFPAGTWRAGNKIGRALGMDANTISCACRGAIEVGLLAKRPGPPGGLRGQRAHEWSATPTGLQMVAKLLTTAKPETVTV